MSSVIEPVTAVEDPWRYGWRYVREVGPDGSEELIRVPLKESDLLHPQEDDFIVTTDLHNIVRAYLRNAMVARIARRPGYHVLCDCRVDWGVPGVEPHGPDIAAFSGVEGWDPSIGTFRVAELGAVPLAVIEITSPSTRKNDFGPKHTEYHQAGIPIYIIVDLLPEKGEPSPQIHGYQWAQEAYQPLWPDEQGRLTVESLGLSIAVENGEVVCFGPDGKVLANYPEVCEAATLAQAEAAESAARATKAEAQAAESAAQATKAEAQAAESAAHAAKAEAQAAESAAQATKSAVEAATARAQVAAATEAARAEAVARAAAESRLAELQAEIERLRSEK